MPIVKEVTGDILNQHEHGIVIVGLNDELFVDAPIQNDALGFLESVQDQRVTLSAIITGVSTSTKLIHAVICHKHENGGWKEAPRAITAALNTLAKHYAELELAIVAIGTGKTGEAQGADWPAIRKAMESSTAQLALYFRDAAQQERVNSLKSPAYTEVEGGKIQSLELAEEQVEAHH